MLTDYLSLEDVLKGLDDWEKDKKYYRGYSTFDFPDEKVSGKSLVDEALHMPSEWALIKRGETVD